jgi:hypothetical protein
VRSWKAGVWGLIPFVLAALLLPGCGYTLVGRGSFLPEYIQTIGVPLFANRTSVFEVEQILTLKVRSELIGRGKYKVLPDEAGVDGVLRGEIVGISITPVSFTGEQQAARYVLALTARLEFFDVRANKVLWSNPAMHFREEYEAASDTNVLDPSAFFGQQSNAVERISTEFGRAVVSALLEAF